MKKFALTLLVASSLGQAIAAPNYTAGVVEYINSTQATAAQKVKAEYLVNSIARIYQEPWQQNQSVFNSISEDISISLSCYLYEIENYNKSGGEALLDEIQALMTDTNAKKSSYLSFMKQDMKTEHSKKDKGICAALV